MYSLFKRAKILLVHGIQSKKRPSFPCFSKIELAFLGLTTFLYCLMMTTAFMRHIPLDTETYIRIFMMCCALIGLGQVFRCVWPEERLALPCTYLGIFLQYLVCSVSLNHLFIPTGSLRIDPFLESVDHLLGFDWLWFTHTFIQYPAFLHFLRNIYLSLMPQMFLVVIFLGTLRQERSLVKFFVTGVWGSLLTLVFWLVFPSSGTASFLLQTHQADFLHTISLTVDKAYGIRMNDLFTHGIDFLSPNETLGLISFPSFHMILTLMLVTAVQFLKPVFYLFVAVNLFMIPAIIIHGGHYLVDLLGGLITFLLATWLAEKTLTQSASLKDHPITFKS